MSGVRRVNRELGRHRGNQRLDEIDIEANSFAINPRTRLFPESKCHWMKEVEADVTQDNKRRLMD